MKSKFYEVYNLIMEEINQNKIGSDITEALPCIFFNGKYKKIELNIDKLKIQIKNLIYDSKNDNVFKYNTFNGLDKDNIIERIYNWFSYKLVTDKLLQAQQILNGLFQINETKSILSTYWTNITGTKPDGFDSKSTSDLCIEYQDGTWEGISLKAQKTKGKTGVGNPSIQTFLIAFLNNFKEVDTILKSISDNIWNNIYKPFFTSFLMDKNDSELIEILKKITDDDFLNKRKKSPGVWGFFLKKFIDKYQNDSIKILNQDPFLRAKNLFLDEMTNSLNKNELNLKNSIKFLNQGSEEWPVRIWKASNNNLIELTDLDEKIINFIKNGKKCEIKKVSSVNCRLFIDGIDIMTFEFRCSHSFKELFGIEYTYKGSNLSSIYTIPYFDKVFIKIDEFNKTEE